MRHGFNTATTRRVARDRVCGLLASELIESPVTGEGIEGLFGILGDLESQPLDLAAGPCANAEMVTKGIASLNHQIPSLLFAALILG